MKIWTAITAAFAGAVVAGFVTWVNDQPERALSLPAKVAIVVAFLFSVVIVLLPLLPPGRRWLGPAPPVRRPVPPAAVQPDAEGNGPPDQLPPRPDAG